MLRCFLISYIRLVANTNETEVINLCVSYLTQPILQISEGCVIGERENEKTPRGRTIIGQTQGPKFFLTSSILEIRLETEKDQNDNHPKLKVVSPSIPKYHFGIVFATKSRNRLIRKYAHRVTLR
eukprot:TRINITY_DN2599_c1_g2_i3.p1 TRINITY_DN2599_c1_g2~~TRINITY_DN2599_c1_g2_i3.p1  ORF type:complete len:125 (+),score=5.02 TRINITY_DN2599_c1_g2_i3:218-592(+)